MLRLFALLLSLLLSSVAYAQQSLDWQPYRHQSSVTPSQYLIEQPSSVSVDAISDFDLNQLRAACSEGCPQPCVPCQPLLVDPVLAQHTASNIWRLELLPDDVMWQSYWAGAKEPRISGTLFEELNSDVSLLDVTLGGRTAVARYGARRNGKPEGWELQLEGAGVLRLNLDEDWDFDAVDFRFGVPLVYAHDHVQWKFAYYHLSSHVGDEFLERLNPGFTRINFSRDTLVAAVSYYLFPSLRTYAEAGWAFYFDGGTKPWEFQFGFDFAQPGPTGPRGTPFVAVNGHLREEVGFGGNFVTQAGWLWRGKGGKVLRTGLHYFNGKSSQFEFFDNFEQQIGWGLWQEF